jgi:hypothetical protein
MNRERQIINLAKRFLIGYFGDGVYIRPETLDKVILNHKGWNGTHCIDSTLHMSYDFHGSIWGKALVQLLEEGKLIYEFKGGVGYCYHKTIMYEKINVHRCSIQKRSSAH